MKPTQQLFLALTTASLSINSLAQQVQALSFNFTPATGMSSSAISGFAAAGSLWSSRLYDPVTINISINFKSLGTGILGGTSASLFAANYSSVKAALAQDSLSSLDFTAVTNLPSGSAVPLYINRLANSPYGSGNATPYLDNDGDANNTTINFTSANFKALGGTLASNFIDADIVFNSDYSFDFDRSNGITSGSFDFVGVAAHEIGHVLGFESGVDYLDTQTTPLTDDQLDAVFIMDLFRYSTASKANNALDWTADSRDKYFSVDGGNTAIARFSTGVNFGDGRQASHWKDNLGLGIMDPTTAPGEYLQISTNDLQLFDAIGWDTVPVPAPPSTLGLWALTIWSGFKFTRYQLQKQRPKTSRKVF